MGCSKVDAGAIVVGVFVTVLLAATMVIAGLKAGITPGVSPLVVLCCWGCLQKVVHSPDGVRFLNLAQVAGSSGMAIVSGVIFAEPLLQVLHLDRASKSLRAMDVSGNLQTMPWDEAKSLLTEHGISIPPVDIGQTLLACIVGALIGLGVVGLASKKFLSDTSLPAPEAHACRTLVMTATDAEAEKPSLGVSLVLSSVSGVVAPFLCHLGLAQENIAILAREGLSGVSFALNLPFSPVYLGIGGLLTLSCSLVMFAGAFMRLVGDYWLATTNTIANPEDPDDAWPANSMRWVGGGAMTVAVLYSMVKFFNPHSGEQSELSDSESALLDIGKKGWRNQSAIAAAGAVLLSIWLFVTEGVNGFSVAMICTILVMTMLMTVLGAMLSLQIGSSASPVSGTVFITTLVLCLVALACGRTSIDDVPVITTLLVAACVAVCSANDTSQDYKTMQLCGVAPREGFLAQAIGLLSGSFVVPFSLYIANDAYGIGTHRLAAPQGQMFAVLIDGLLLSSSVPWYPVLTGLGIGVVAVALDVAASKVGMQLPAMAMAVGLYLPAEMGVGILLGSMCRFAGEQVRRRWKGLPQRTHESILAAAGLITGSAFADLVLGITTLFGFNISSMKVFSPEEDPDKVHILKPVQVLVALAGITWLLAILYHNSLHGVAESAEGEENSGKAKAKAWKAVEEPSAAAGELNPEPAAQAAASV